MNEKCGLVWTRRGRTRSEAAARGRGERRRGGGRRGASRRDTQIIMKAMEGGNQSGKPFLSRHNAVVLIDKYDSQVAPRAIRAPAQVVLKVLAGRPGALFEHFARDEVWSHWSARGNSGSGSLERFIVARQPGSREIRGVRFGLNAVWMPEY